jgi:hypothetical protein
MVIPMTFFWHDLKLLAAIPTLAPTSCSQFHSKTSTGTPFCFLGVDLEKVFQIYFISSHKLHFHLFGNAHK